MYLKEIIKQCAVYLGKENVIEYLETINNQPDEETLLAVNTLTRCANLTINELASTYIPMIKKETRQVENGKIYYSTLSEHILEIVEITNLSGESVYCKIKTEYVEVNETNVIIYYKYLPSNYDLNSQIGYQGNEVQARVIAYGATAEYCLTEKAFNESVMWRNRFTDSISLICLPKSSKVRERRFI